MTEVGRRHIIGPARDAVRAIRQSEGDTRRGRTHAPSCSLRHPGQHLVNRQRLRHPVRESGHHFVRGCPFPVHQAVGLALHPLPNRLKGHRHHRRGQDG